MFGKSSQWGSALAAVVLSLLALGNAQGVANFTPLASFPNEQHGNVTRWLNRAASLGNSKELWRLFQGQCIIQQVYSSLFVMPPGFVKPFSPFDRLYFVGQVQVSAWAYDTGDGLILIDALNSQEEVEKVLLPGLQAFGFKGSDIKHLIITHEHGDHYGGAQYIQKTFGTKVYASAAFWSAVASNTAAPIKDQTLVDLQELTVGNVTITAVATPGHTAGTISLFFPVYLKGVKHVAGLNGGTGIPSAQALREQKIVSQTRFGALGRKFGADVMISNHQIVDDSLFHSDLLAHPSDCTKNPFIIGVDLFDKSMQIHAICTRVLAARQGMNLNV